MNSGRIVIVAYKPHPGKLEDLRTLLKSHIAILDGEGLVTKRKPVIAEAMDGTMVEVFEWKSSEAIDLAHSNPRVQKLWEQFSGVCDYIPLSQIDEAKNLFSEFSPFDPSG
jgi:hypothetical protein